ncbi:MAG: NAD(P)(+) transhydrogenase (Re/Si-specific) subunit beta [Desulfobacterales bacterium]
MSDVIRLVPDLTVIAVLLVGVALFRTPLMAKHGNRLAALAMLLGVALTIGRDGIAHPVLLMLSMGAGAGLGWWFAAQVNMVQIPAMVAFQHGAGGLAAGLVAYVELLGNRDALTSSGLSVGVVGLFLGMATFSASLVASGKLSGRIRSTPHSLPFHGALLLLLVSNAVLVAFLAFIFDGAVPAVLLLISAAISIAVGVLFAMRVGGADMPVLISFLNATAGLAAAACGIVLQNRLLIAFGATVAASGSILTHIMCKGMNRRLSGVFAGHQGKTKFRPFEIFNVDQASPAASADSGEKPVDVLVSSIEAVRRSNTVVIIPGYGMALAQAQFKVVQLANRLRELGKQVKFAIHPVAGRMPGHMHVLLAEADVDYALLHEMDEVNDEFKTTDLALVVGACDVVNPAAMQIEGTPLSGMPILMAQDASSVIVCNLDRKPGYSGVENLLYRSPNAMLLLGDARNTVGSLLDALEDTETSIAAA